MRSDPVPASRAVAEAEALLGALGRRDASGDLLPEAVTMNFLALTGEDLDPPTEEMVNEVMADLFARAYVVRSCPTQPPGTVAVRVSHTEHGDSAHPLIVPRTDLWLAPDVSRAAGSVVGPLLRPRLETVVYVAPGADQRLVEAVLPIGDQVVTDVARAPDGALWVARQSPTRLVDVTFLRGLRWRELAARWFDDPEWVSAAWDIRRVAIIQIPGSHGGAVESELLVAWLGSRLGWRPRGTEVIDRAGHPVDIELRTVTSAEAPLGSLQAMHLTAAGTGGELRGSIVRDAAAQRLVWSLTAPGRETRSLRVPAALPEFTHLVSRALGHRDRDPTAGECLRWLGEWKTGG
jgi:hypothetical protein